MDDEHQGPGEGTVVREVAGGRRHTPRRVLVGTGAVVATHLLPPNGPVLVGRSPEAGIHIEDPSVSRLHVRLHVGATVGIEDLGSANGTTVGQVRLRPGETVTLTPGLMVDIGTSWIMLAGAATKVSAPAPPRKLGPGPAAAVPVEPAAGGAPALVIADETMQALHGLIERVALSDISVVLYGETGVGKEVFARRLHELSRRRDRPFVGLNCAALSETLLESELFGHERGAFTGAVQAKAGLLETAEGGTLLLDEIGEVALAIQVKLLRVLEERQVLRLGSTRPRTIDVRVLSATNRDLEAASEAGSFRRDLYFRLNGIKLEIPPLRERRSEIEPMAREFLTRAAERAGVAASLVVDPEVWERLRRYRWPGNIRQLRNVMERAIVLADGGPVTLDHLPVDTYVGPSLAALAAQPPVALAGIAQPTTGGAPLDRDRVIEALDRCAGNQTRAAEMLGVSRRTLVKRLAAYNLPRPRKG